MTRFLSPAKVVLLAVDLVVQVQLSLVYELASQYRDVLRQELLFRILLTYLPETTPAADYVDLVQRISRDDFNEDGDATFDTAPVDALTDDQAYKKVRKLHLLPLRSPDAPKDGDTDPLVSFILHRAYRLDEEAGMLEQLPTLVGPFLDHSATLRSWMAFTVLPLLRRDHEYYREESKRFTLRQFQQLDDNTAVQFLLGRTGQTPSDIDWVGRDLRGLVGPWLHNALRWPAPDPSDVQLPAGSWPGWQHVLDWLIAQASTSWQVAVRAYEEWDGPCDSDFGDILIEHSSNCRLRQLELSYAKAAIASAYLGPEPTPSSLEGAHQIINRARSVLGMDLSAPLEILVGSLPAIKRGTFTSRDARVVGHLRNDLLQASNCLTEPSTETVDFVSGLTLSAYILTSLGVPSTVRRAGTLVLLRDRREQKNELTKLIHHLLNHAPRNDDGYWAKARLEILWLHNWGQEDHVPDSSDDVRGVFGMLSKDDIETELLKSMLSNMRRSIMSSFVALRDLTSALGYTLVNCIYEDATNKPLSKKAVQDAVHHAALDAFDNASNPNRTRGGLKKCNDM